MWAEALVRRGAAGAVTWADGRAEAAGLANVATGEPMTPRHRFRIGSATKTYTAYLTTLLVDDLDEVVVDDAITWRHLLTHRSGLFDATYDGEHLEELLFAPPARVDPRRLTATSLSYPRRFPPGTQYHYCNTNYEFVALALEERTGTPFPQLLGERVLGPLGLERTTFEEEPVVPAGAAHGYALWPGMFPVEDGLRDVTERLIGAWADGALCSDVFDLVRFFAHAVPLLCKQELGVHRYGEAWGHSGGMAGYLTNVRFPPAVAVLANTQSIPLSRAVAVATTKLSRTRAARR